MGPQAGGDPQFCDSGHLKQLAPVANSWEAMSLAAATKGDAGPQSSGFDTNDTKSMRGDIVAIQRERINATSASAELWCVVKKGE
jgi:hypothetical protein